MITKARFRAIAGRRLNPAVWLAFGALVLGGALAVLRPAAAQEAPATLELATVDELYDLVGPIALYPDDLVAIVLPASTYPLQIVQAARFLEDRERDASLQPDEEWDDSIVALLNYPEVVELLNDDLDWTYDLGTAVLNQRADVLNAIQDFRDEAYAAGNLRSDDRQTVARENDTIVIEPADPQVIYVPYYEPREVVVYQTVPVYHYYPHRYAVYYYPYPAHYAFDVGFFWGVRSWYSIGWHTHHVHLYDWHYHGHPYFGWRYYDPFYVHNVFVNVNVNRDHIWRPRHRYGGRPVVRGNEGRVYTADRAPRRGVLDSNAAAARTREGSVYRAQPGTARAQQGSTSARTTQGAQPRRGVPSTAYRDRAAQTTERATRAAQARAPSVSGSVQAQGRQPPTTSQGAYRSGGGMSQALERNRAVAQTSREARSAPVSPRAVQRSTGMPREAARSAPAPRASAPAPRAPSQGGGVSAQRSDSGGASRGSSGGSYRGGGSTRGAHPAARNSAGR
jgi:hypothetical protein